MAKQVICDILEDLLEEEFKRFKWQLWNGVSSIPRGKLENAKHHDVVDLIVQQYGTSDGGKIAVRALQNMKQNDRALQLKGKLKEVSEEVCAEGGASSDAADGKASPARVNVNINCDNKGNVKAPVVHGGVFNGPVNFS